MKGTSVLAGTCKLVVVFALCGAPPLIRGQRSIAHYSGPGFQAAGAGQVHFFAGHHHPPIGGPVGGNPVYGGHPGHGGYPYYGWTFGLSLGWGPYIYGPVFPYWYGYGVWTAPPPAYYQQYRQCDYRYNDCSAGHGSPEMHSVPRQSLNPPSSNQDLEAPTDSDPDSARATKLIAYRPQPAVRHEVQNAITVLRAMPPAARERWLASGHYKNFSSQEREALKRVSDNLPESTLSLR